MEPWHPTGRGCDAPKRGDSQRGMDYPMGIHSRLDPSDIAETELGSLSVPYIEFRVGFLR